MQGDSSFEEYCLQELASHPINVQTSWQNLDVHRSSTPSKKEVLQNYRYLLIFVSLYRAKIREAVSKTGTRFSLCETLSVSVMEIILKSQVIDYIQCKIPSNYLQISSKRPNVFLFKTRDMAEKEIIEEGSFYPLFSLCNFYKDLHFDYA